MPRTKLQVKGVRVHHCLFGVVAFAFIQAATFVRVLNSETPKEQGIMVINNARVDSDVSKLLTPRNLKSDGKKDTLITMDDNVVANASTKWFIPRNWKSDIRSERFPGVEERVRFYMSNWYHPPCPSSTNTARLHYHRYDGIHSLPTVSIHNPLKNEIGSINFTGSIKADRPVVMDRKLVRECARNQTHNLINYCIDAIEMLERFEKSGSSSTPLLVAFGDGSIENVMSKTEIPWELQLQIPIPYLGKTRAVAVKPPALEKHGRHCTETRSALQIEPHSPLLSPIIWKINTIRHWSRLKQARESDIPWEEKKNAAVWRGDASGEIDEYETDSEEMCTTNLRCNFVLKHGNSIFIDAGLTDPFDEDYPDVVSGEDMIKPVISFEEQQRFKMLFSFEGNDVSTGLKWQLLSKSVVLMPKPTRTSWAMEELLEPWVHYVPLKKDASDAEEMVQWVLEHDEEAHEIAKQATVFMEDMVYHPDAERDEEMIKQEILRRYRNLWI